jgi:hypothetical protein
MTGQNGTAPEADAGAQPETCGLGASQAAAGKGCVATSRAEAPADGTASAVGTAAGLAASAAVSEGAAVGLEAAAIATSTSTIGSGP